MFADDTNLFCKSKNVDSHFLKSNIKLGKISLVSRKQTIFK